MKISTLPALLALASGLVAPRPASPRSEIDLGAAPASLAVSDAPVEAPATAMAAALPDSTSLVPIDAPAPTDMKVEVRRDGAAGVLISVRRRGQVITLRRGGARVVAPEQAQIRVARGEEDAAPLIWETTAPGSLVTTRGLVLVAPPAPDASSRAGKLPSATLRLTAAPAAIARDEGPRHACVAEDDGLGGFTVLCRVDAMAFAASLTGATPREGITVVAGDRALVRLDLPAPVAGVAAALVGYTDGLHGVVIRAEASRLPGEDRPSMTVVSASRAQPLPPPPPPRPHWGRRLIDPIF